jgi:hypothetical protein
MLDEVLLTAAPLTRGLPVAPRRVTRNTAQAVRQPLPIGIAHLTRHFPLPSSESAQAAYTRRI